MLKSRFRLLLTLGSIDEDDNDEEDGDGLVGDIVIWVVPFLRWIILRNRMLSSLALECFFEELVEFWK